MSEQIEFPEYGVISSYRRSKTIIHPRFAILHFAGFETRNDAYKLIGKKVKWKSRAGKVVKGTITRVHGKKGAVCGHFKEGGLPGEALGQKIELL